MIIHLRDSHDARIVGGKAVNLARLLNADFTVPDGFVITTRAFIAAMSDGNLPTTVPATLAAQIAERYRALGSPTVAVRSSATAEDLADASMAGQYETLLDIHGEAAVIDAVAHCWRSIDTPRTRSYLASKGIPLSDVAMAVVVQRLVPADVAGVLFTVNPRSGRTDELLIEASWGLGESVVSGKVQPDTLVVERTTGVVRHAVIADKATWFAAGAHGERAVSDDRRRAPCLDAQQVEALRQLGEQVERHFGSPQDLEWAIHAGQLFLLQSRAITTMGAAAAVQARCAVERAALSAELVAGRGPWVRHNLSETLPQPTPLTWSLISRFMSGDGGFGALYREIGFAPSPAVCRDGFLRLIAGRIHLDLAAGPELFSSGYPFAYDLELLRANPDAAQDPPTIAHGSARERLAAARLLTKVDARLTTLAVDEDQRLMRTTIPAFTAWIAGERRIDLTNLDNTTLLSCWQRRAHEVLDLFAPRSLMPSVITATLMARLRAFTQQHSWDADPLALADLLAAGGEANCTVRATAQLRDVASGTMSVDAWLNEHGHRAPIEFDLATPRWRERPQQVLALAAHLTGGVDPLDLHGQHDAAAKSAASTLRLRLSASECREFDQLLALVHRYLRWREDGKHWLMLGYEQLRLAALEAGRRLNIGDGIFMLTGEEFARALTSGYAPLALIAQRRAQRAVEAKLHLPSVIASDDLATLGQAPALALSATAGGDHLSAFVISAGVCRGPARIVLTPESAGDLGSGYVLVCPSTDPSWTPLFVNAAGLVLERGGALSHGAVVARELGIPAVVLADATTLLREGEPLLIDGNDGAVRRGADLTAPPAAQTTLHLTRAQLPPPVSQRERVSARWRNLLLVLWSGVFAAIFLLPPEHLYTPIIRGFDALLWPLVPLIGLPGVVAGVSVVMAVLVMAVQRATTDNRRLLVAKERAARLRAEAMTLPGDSPRRDTLLATAAPVQWRIMGASFVPLAVLLGPMIMSVCWLMDRCDRPNDRPGVEATLRVLVDGDATAPITLSADAGMPLDEQTPAIQAVPPIRATLVSLRQRWSQTDPPATDVAWEVRAAAASARAATLADLDAYLAEPIAEQLLVWKVTTPTTPGRHLVRLSTGMPPQTVEVPLVLGATLPGEPLTFLAEGKFQGWRQIIHPSNSPIHEVMVVTSDPSKTVASSEPPPFYQPFRALGWNWDMGWITLYLVTYLPAMFLARWLLRVA